MNDHEKMAFGLLDGRDDGEHNGVGLVDISKLFATQDDFILGDDPVRWSIH